MRDPAPRPEETIVLEGWLPPEAAAYDTSSLRYLPFTVPEGVTRLTVRRQIVPRERDIVALLLFDPRGIAEGASGFRGYQGAVNLDEEFSLTGDPDTTTPWYTPGPIPPGRWHLGQWFIQPAAGGLRYRYTITLGFDGDAASTETPQIAEPPSSGVLDALPGWYMGSVHNHTVYSYDTHIGGRARTVDELVDEHAAAGFRFIAVTDHNQPRAHADLAAAARRHPDLLLLVGNELTTLHGHAGILGGRPGAVFDFRRDPGDGGVRAIIEVAHRQGALFVVNHPFGDCIDCAWRYPEEEWEEADAVEVWNRAWSPANRKALDWWDARLRAGRRIPVIGGGDYHRGENPFRPVLWAYAEDLSRAAVLEAIRRGRCVVSEGPRGPFLDLASADGVARIGDTLSLPRGTDTVPVRIRVRGGRGLTLRVVSSGGEIVRPVASEDEELTLDVPAGDPPLFVRAEALRGETVAALTNPLYLEAAP